MTARTEKGIEMDARDLKAGMTLEELRQFVNIATDDGVPGATPVRVGIGWRSNIQKIRIDYTQENDHA